jgi:TRAP-type C4-dicarboxylate transport system substrate-binding protein
MRFPVFGAVFSTAATIATIASGLSAPASAQEVTLRLHTFLAPVANPPKTFLIPWIQKVEKASNGKLKVQPFWAMQLGGREVQLLDQVRDGVVDIAWTLPGFTPGRMPRVEPFELPFVHKDPVSSALALQDYQAKHLGPDLADYHPLVLNTHAGFLLQTKDPILKMSDLKGKKIRGASRASVWLLEAIGATGVGLPLNELPQALSTGVIDGSLLPFEIAPAVKMQDLVSHFSELSGPQPRLGTNVFTFLMNKQSYSKLSAELKKVIDDNSGRNIAKWAGENWAEIEKPGRDVVASKSKNKFHTIAPDEVAKMRAAAQPVFNRWFDEMKKINVDGPALLADARAMIDKYSK